MTSLKTSNNFDSVSRDEIETIAELAGTARKWLVQDALPMWWNNGFDWQHGTWQESLDMHGVPTDQNRRARVQGRQTYVFSQIENMEIVGPWNVLVHAGMKGIFQHYCDSSGLLQTVLSSKAQPVDQRKKLYDQTFAILALASARREVDEAENQALSLLIKIEDNFRKPGVRGFVENCDMHPFQSNAHMHLLEAAMAWAEGCKEDGVSGLVWESLANEIVDLALDRFIDHDGGFLREFFNEDWQPKEGRDGTIVEPGHQFEWAWLLARWARFAGRPECLEAAKRLFRSGAAGVHELHGAAVNTLDDKLRQVTGDARLWPQTEWLKAALVLFEMSQGAMRPYYLNAVKAAWTALAKYLDTGKPGLWFDNLRADGQFEKNLSPASSFYHIAVAVTQLCETSERTCDALVKSSAAPNVIRFPMKKVASQGQSSGANSNHFGSFH